MDVAHAILFAKAIDISRVTADYSSAKFEIIFSSVTIMDRPSCIVKVIGRITIPSVFNFTIRISF